MTDFSANGLPFVFTLQGSFRGNYQEKFPLTFKDLPVPPTNYYWEITHLEASGVSFHNGYVRNDTDGGQLAIIRNIDYTTPPGYGELFIMPGVFSKNNAPETYYFDVTGIPVTNGTLPLPYCTELLISAYLPRSPNPITITCTVNTFIATMQLRFSVGGCPGGWKQCTKCQHWDYGTHRCVSNTPLTCPPGQVWDAVTCECVPDNSNKIANNPFSFEDDRNFGNYHVTGLGTGGVAQYYRNGFPIPGSVGWDTFSLIADATGGVNRDPRVVRDHRGIIYAVYSKPSIPNTYLKFSLDEGATWSDPVVSIAGGTHPTIAVGLDGTLIIAAYVGAVGGPGVIKYMLQHTGDASFSTLSTMKDSAGTALVAADDTFHIQQGAEGAGRWFLHMVIQSSGFSSHYFSMDECETWIRV